jgi:hypothetical protein
MFDIYFIVSLFLFSILCFFELIIFNEEILLALCFFSFIFFMFNSMGDTIYETFKSRATKFEEDLLISFGLSKQALTAKFAGYLALRGFASKFTILSTSINNYLVTFTRYYSYKSFTLFLTSSQSKLNELSIFESKLITVFQEKCVSLFLYPLIFTTSKNNIVLLENSASGSSLSVNKVNALSSICR